MPVLGVKHVLHVRTLYKAILRLHRGMPIELQQLGNEYVRDEFRRHKDASPEFAAKFIQEWAKYYVTLSSQLLPKQISKTHSLGKDLTFDSLNDLREDQIGQLHELFLEIKKLNEASAKNP